VTNQPNHKPLKDNLASSAPGFTYDPEGILPPGGSVELKHDRVGEVEESSLILTGLTEKQADDIGKAVAKALSPYQSRTAAVAAKAGQFALLMLFLSGILWLIAAVVTNLPTN
jgi:hypothetical protein